MGKRRGTAESVAKAFEGHPHFSILEASLKWWLLDQCSQATKGYPRLGYVAHGKLVDKA